MRRTHLSSLVFAALLVATMAGPAVAQDSVELSGVERALEAARQAVELASDFADPATPTETSDPGSEGPGNEDPGDGDPGSKCKSNSGKSDKAQDRSNNGKSDKAKDKSNNGKSDEPDDCDDDGSSGNANNGKSNRPDQAESLKGRERAAQAIAAAMERGNGNGNGFGRGHSAEVIEKLLNGESPATIEGEDNHGALVSAMVKAYNELRRQGTDGG